MRDSRAAVNTGRASHVHVVPASPTRALKRAPRERSDSPATGPALGSTARTSLSLSRAPSPRAVTHGSNRGSASSHIESRRIEPSRVGSSWVELGRVGSSWVELGRVGSSWVESGQAHRAPRHGACVPDPESEPSQMTRLDWTAGPSLGPRLGTSPRADRRKRASRTLPPGLLPPLVCTRSRPISADVARPAVLLYHLPPPPAFPLRRVGP